MAKCLRCNAGNEWIEGDTRAAPRDDVVVVPLELARFVRKVWLPLNPNKLRSAAPETVAAAKQFIALVESQHGPSGGADK